MSDYDSKKAEILAKSRKAKRDEGFDYAETRGNKIGVFVYAVVAAVLMIFSFPDHADIFNAIAALSFAWVVGGTISYYRFTKKKVYLLYAIASAIVTTAFTLLVILEHLAS
jgi:uncharacterized membrane protein